MAVGAAAGSNTRTDILTGGMLTAGAATKRDHAGLEYSIRYRCQTRRLPIKQRL
jgi:hypothetical protein